MANSKKRGTSTYDIIIVGGGITGAAIGYGLAIKGCNVAIIDAPTQTNKASRTNVGLIWCQSKFLHLPDYARWGFHSAALFPELIQELEQVSGITIPVCRQGGLIACLGDEEYQQRGDYIDKLKATLGNYPGEMITREKLESKLPGIAFGPQVSGAAWCDADGLIDPLALLRAYKLAFSKVGGTLIESLVHDVQPHNNSYLVTTKNGIFDCGKIILAAGLANRRFAKFSMSHIPVTADKGQVLLVERMPAVMPVPILGMAQTFGGTIIIGFRHEALGHDTRIVPESVSTEGAWALKVWPALAKKRLIRAWSGLRVMPDDKQAIYSKMPDHPNAFLVNTHSAVTLAAAHTRHLPEFILGGELPAIACGMTLKRFGYDC